MDKPHKDRKLESDISPVDISPKTPEEFLRRGWLYLSQRDYDKAIADFTAALQSAKENPDIYYALGLAYKGSGKKENAITAFKKALEYIEQIDNINRGHMLTRLTHGHINQLDTGDWNLEKEIWQRK